MMRATYLRLTILFVLLSSLLLPVTQIARAQTSACPPEYAGFLAPRLTVGQRGVVAPGGNGNRVRDAASTSGQQLGTLPPETEFEVLDGPACDSSSGIIWWRVRSDDGLEGWTAEGLDGEYFLEPIIPPGPTLTPSMTATQGPTSTPRPSNTPRPTWTPTPTPIVAVMEPLDLPELETLSADNIADMELIADVPAPGALSLDFSREMNYVVLHTYDRSGFALGNLYSFPQLELITQWLPLDRAAGNASRGGAPRVLYSAEGSLMVSVNYSGADIIYYQPGDETFTSETEWQRSIRSAVMTEEGILIIGFYVSGEEEGRYLCFIDKFGSRYAPDDRLCLEQELAITGLALLEDGERLLAATESRLLLYRISDGTLLQSFPYGLSPFDSAIALVPGTEADGSLPTVMLSRDGFMLSVNLQTREERTYPNGSSQRTTELVMSSDGRYMMLIARPPRGQNLPQIYAYEIASKTLYQREEFVLFGGEGAAFSPDASLAYINGVIYDTAAWEPQREFGGDQNIITFSPDGTLLVVRNSSTRSFEFYGVRAS